MTGPLYDDTPVTGDDMQALLGLTALGALLAPLPKQAGVVTYYNPGVMERVYEYRLSIGQIEPCLECEGYAAMLEPQHIGRKIWLWHRGRLHGPFLVVDCANRRDLPNLLARGLIAEVDYDSGQRLGLHGPERAVIARVQ